MNEKDTDFSSVFTYFCQKVPELGMVHHGNWFFLRITIIGHFYTKVMPQNNPGITKIPIIDFAAIKDLQYQKYTEQRIK